MEIAFELANDIDISGAMHFVSNAYGKQLERFIVPLGDEDSIDNACFTNSVTSMIIGHGGRDPDGIEGIASYARPHLSRLPDGDGLHSLAVAVADTFLTRLREWRKMDAPDGRTIIDNTPHHQWLYWAALGYTEFPWDVVITNQMIASAEYIWPELHSSLRGGLTIGTTNASRTAQFQAFSWVSTFPFGDAPPSLIDLRQGEIYTAEESARLAGLFLAHEIGHLLFHFGHPTENPACIMSPIADLRFRRWREKLSPDQCQPGSTAAMAAGAFKPYYWLQ